MKIIEGLCYIPKENQSDGSLAVFRERKRSLMAEDQLFPERERSQAVEVKCVQTEGKKLSSGRLAVFRERKKLGSRSLAIS